jgi:hypothetical protein
VKLTPAAFAVVGVPLTIPVPDPMVKPAGRAPEAMDQMYGVVPPVAVKVCEYATPTDA